MDEGIHLRTDLWMVLFIAVVMIGALVSLYFMDNGGDFVTKYSSIVYDFVLSI